MKILTIGTIAALVFTRVASGGVAHHTARTYVTTEVIEGRKKPVYHAISEEYRFVAKGLYANRDEYLGLRTYRFEICKHTRWSQGMDGIESQLHVRAFMVDQHGKTGKLLWGISHAGHEFWNGQVHDQHVFIVERACCDGVDRINTYSALNGKFIESHELARGER